MLKSRIGKNFRKAILFLLLLIFIITLAIFIESLRLSLILLLFAIGVGWLISLPLWLILRFKPSLRMYVYNHRGVRWMMVGAVFLLAIPTLIILYTFLRSYVTVTFYSVTISDPFPAPSGQYQSQIQSPSDIVERHGNMMTKELWFRQMALPPLRKSCYSSEEVCEIVDNMVGMYSHLSHPDWAVYLTTIGITLLLSLPGGLFAWLYTKKPKDENLIMSSNIF